MFKVCGGEEELEAVTAEIEVSGEPREDPESQPLQELT